MVARQALIWVSHPVRFAAAATAGLALAALFLAACSGSDADLGAPPPDATVGPADLRDAPPGRLFVLAVKSGEVHSLDADGGPLGWSADASEIFVAPEGRGVLAVRTSGETRELAPAQELTNVRLLEAAPDGRRVAVAARRRVVIIDTEGTRLDELPASDVTQLGWSQDGRRLAYATGEPPRVAVWEADRPSGVYDGAVRFAWLDGGRLAILTPHAAGDIQLESGAGGSTDSTRLAIVGDGASLVSWSVPSAPDRIAIAADVTVIAYALERGSAKDAERSLSTVRLHDAETGTLLAVFDGAALDSRIVPSPFSPARAELLLPMRLCGPEPPVLAVGGADGSTVEVGAFHPAFAQWSADGDALLAMSGAQVWLAGREMGSARQILAGAQPRSARLSPDGLFVAFVSLRGGFDSGC